MKRWPKTLAVSFAAMIGLTAWDTLVIEGPTPWQSIYQMGEPKSIPEHSTLSDMTLKSLDPSGTLVDLFGRQGSATISAVDINASHFREELLYKIRVEGRTEDYGDDALTDVEERLIPPPANFAGLPDYSYGVYDWLNKNKTCPAFSQSEYAWRCHEFKGWLGALNSVHFGTQAQKMYAHHHQNALVLATQVAELRASMSEDERKAHHDLLIEAEHEALVYEGYAQHFLQDRWAIGHMWERWGSPDTSQTNRFLDEHLAIGGLSGMIHGTESITGFADPMSSPLPSPDTDTTELEHSLPMEFVHVAGEVKSPVPAIGDERLQDARDGVFQLTKYNSRRLEQSLDVKEQMETMLRCAGAGWAETIRALGPGDDSGTYGAYNAPLSAGAPSFPIIDEKSCWDMWATNKSMVTGLLGASPGEAIILMGKANYVVEGLGSLVPGELEERTRELTISATRMAIYGQSNPYGLENFVPRAQQVSRRELTINATRMWIYGQSNPNGTEIAQGKMTAPGASLLDWLGGEGTSDLSGMWGFKQGGHYKIPDYVEPIGLIADTEPAFDPTKAPPLPMEDVRGRDIQTLYGAFNRAHSDFWCQNRETLTELRTFKPGKEQEICQRLADFAYQGTHPSYTGTMKRTRKHDETEIRSVCAIHEKGIESDDTDDEDNPYWLDQGYTAYDGAKNAEQSFTSIKQVANWCARTPILRLSSDPENSAENIVAEIPPDAETVQLAGRDLGSRNGRVTAIAPDGTEIELNDIWEWSDSSVTIGVSDIEWEENTKYRLRVELEPNPDRAMDQTVGLFYLKIGEYVDMPVKRQVFIDLGGVGPCGDAVQDIDFIDLAKSIPEKENRKAIEKMLKTYRKDLAEVKPYLEKQLQCMKTLREERLSIIREFVEDYPENFRVTHKGFTYIPLLAQSHLQISHPNSASDPMFSELGINFSTQGNSPTLMIADEANIWDGDVYTSQIDNLAGTIQLLEKTELLIQGWDIALEDKKAFITSSKRDNNKLGEMLTEVDDIGGLMEIAFVDYRDDRDLRKLLKSKRSRERLKASRWENARIELGTAGLQLNELLEGLSNGLRPWTQAQHTLTQIAIPKASNETLRIKSELKMLLQKEARMWSCQIPDGCSANMLDTSSVDFNERSALISWINDLHIAMRPPQESLFQMMDANDMLAGRSAPQSFIYLDENGLKRSFISWPTERANNIALTWPDGVNASHYE